MVYALGCFSIFTPGNRSLAQIEFLQAESIFRTFFVVGVVPGKAIFVRGNGVELKVCRNRHRYRFIRDNGASLDFVRNHNFGRILGSAVGILSCNLDILAAKFRGVENDVADALIGGLAVFPGGAFGVQVENLQLEAVFGACRVVGMAPGKFPLVVAQRIQLQISRNCKC